MPEKRMMRLGAFMRPVGIHTAWWRYPGAWPDANFNLKHIVRLAQKLEAGKFDAFFMADHLAVLNMPMAALKRSATVTSFDPMALLPALAMVTERLGLIATGSTTFDAPYHVARRFASLDHVSEGRAGWNIVTTSNPDSALNFGLDEHMEHDERYRRAREFFDVVTGLWDSFADDAFIRDVENGIYFDPDRMHVLNHVGKYFKVRGPLNIARPVQGWPLIVQAGASDSGRQLAAETAEMIFSPGGLIADCQSYYNDVKARAAAAGRDPEHVKILPGCLVVVGDTDDEARAKRAKLDSLVHPDSGIASCRSPSAWTRRSSIWMRHCPTFLKPTRAKAGATGWLPAPARQPDRSAVDANPRRVWRAVDGRHGEDDRRQDGRILRRQSLRRVQHHVPLGAWWPRRVRRQCRPGTAAPRRVPQGI